MTRSDTAVDFGRGRIPLVDLSCQSREIDDEVRQGFARVIESSAFIEGPDVAAFEKEFAFFSGVECCVGVANGTDAIELALRAAGVGSGDEVIVPANTFVATAEAVVRAGARPVLADCDPDSLLLDVESVRAWLSPATRAVIPVHLFGQLAPMERFTDLQARGCLVIEDAAQAQGATREGRGIGAWGGGAATSFYPGKNLGAFGDGGAVLTNDHALAARVRAIRNHGESRRYRHDLLGFNSRLDTLQAVVLRAKLRRLDAWNAQRRAAARRYGDRLRGLPAVGVPGVLAGNEHVWHLYVVRVPERDGVLQRMQKAGIGVAVHYPEPIHLQPAFAWLGCGPGDFPVAEAAAAEILSLPIFPGITAAQQDRVVDALARALRDVRVA